jgi:hypothetical protein
VVAVRPAEREVVRLAAGQGAYGESPDLLHRAFLPSIDYVVCDSLAETTCGYFALDRRRDESAGFAPDLAGRVALAVPYVVERGTRLLTNAGGLNPLAAHQRAVAAARESGGRGLRVGVVAFDHPVAPDTGRRPAPFAEQVYLGAAGVVAALEQGADIVITGRVADAALFLAPLVHEYGWAWDDWERLAAGAAVGHLLECSGQCAGGNWSGAWWETFDPVRLAQPVAEVHADGTAVITKAAGSSGRVSFDTVREQLLYEVHDPAAYLTPDVVVDLTTARLDDLGDDRVRLHGVTGHPRPATLKGLTFASGGQTGEVVLSFAWPDAEAKCRHVLAGLRAMAEREHIPVRDWHEEFFGVGGFGGPTLAAHDRPDDPPEVTGRLAWRCDTLVDAVAVQRLVGRIALHSPAGLQGIGRRRRGAGGPAELLRVDAFHVERDTVECEVVVRVEEI